jgi:type IV fimbrial biogenesis protein FimT
MKFRGFTLIELMVTVVIIAISLALAAPSFVQLVSNYRLRGAAESIVNGLNLARAEAVRRNAQVSFALTGTKSGWTVTDSGGAVIQTRADSETGGLTAASSNSATSVTFLPTGLVNATGTWLTQVDLSSSASGTGTRRINVIGGGLIRMCDPAVTLTNDPRRC